MNTPGQNANAVAELAIGMMIMQSRHHFDGSSGTELKGKTLGLHAYGFVGKCVARIAKGFGMEIYAYDPFLTPEMIEVDGVKALKNVDELYSTCQFVSLHIPATKETKNSINYNLLSKMPLGAMLVNTARKEVVDEASLVKVFEDRKDFRYVSDIAPDNAFVIAEKFAGRYYFTPKKLGAQTEEANINAGLAAARQIVAFLQHGDKTFQVNKF
jgi:D-3-phosphoglycerate dehydrogenase